MASKKEPPFFNEDNIGTCHCKFTFYEIMELFIETLTGTCFELRVSPFETIISVKAKIQRLEGIPVSQQHLIWNNVELEDDYCLNDYDISEGCTLKLILSMRGGPINTRRVPVEDSVREITEYMDPNQADLWEKIPSSKHITHKHITFLVYREGDQLNIFRVVDRGDGTLTPISESLSAGSVYNLYGENSEDKEASPSGQQIIENSITMNKMKLLKTKMENKKPKQIIKMNPRSPVAPCSLSGSVTAAHHNFFRAPSYIGQSCLTPGNLHTSETSQNALPVLATTGRRMPSSNFIKESNRWENVSESQSITSMLTPDKLMCGGKEDAKVPPDTVLPLSAQLKSSEKNTETGVSINEKGPFLYPDTTNVNLNPTEEKVFKNTDVLTRQGEANISEACSELYGTGKVNKEPQLSEWHKDSAIAKHPDKSIIKPLTFSAAETSFINSQDICSQRNAHLSPLQCSAQIVHHSPRKPQTQSKCLEVGNLRPDASPNVLRPLEVHNSADSSYARNSRFHSIGMDSLGKRPASHSKKETREITGMTIKASKDPVLSVNNVGFRSSLTRSTNRDGLKNSCGMDRFRNCGIVLTSDLQHFQEERFNMVSPHNDMPEYLLSSGLGLNGNIVTTGKRTSCQTHFPPVNGSIQLKKKKAKHCFFCGKKTGLATSYECRCGNNFCATHRYAEAHTCTYDYKNSGRKYLQETNPVVSATKLPKI
ncbi:AN1-type zinc finger protein 4 isoform X2 [Sceloporus undulatus]|uniref:AN1-type zinc finger protein 4 isoform X2 n=1 Tax=Sceloporus undulatus TaxID=8520 RepID=UPI001C4B7F4A|nr:AN1-type zinc finger protein 4 isoform X2 [Sceloporus undulatus]